MIRTHLDCHPSRRVATGILTIGDDWPGIFIRGDEALGMAKVIELYFHYHEINLSDHPPIKQVVEMLKSCDTKAKAA